MIPSYVSCTSRPFRMLALTADQKILAKSRFFPNRGRPRPRSRTNRPLQTRSTQKQQIMNYCFVKLNYHAEPNHPAKYGGPGVHRLKVSFYRHNGMSLIFKEGGLTAAETRRRKNFFGFGKMTLTFLFLNIF